VDINDVHEENCLLRYALTTDGVVDIYTWFWTDATDQDTTGVWMHSSTGEEVAWFGKKPFKCEHDGNAMIVDFDKRSLYNGRWCTEISTASHRYICKALI